MNKVAVIVPYYQHKSGILRRALQSATQQRVPKGMEVDLIVIDDGSPISAKTETEGMIFSYPFSLSVILQKNAGVSAARNRGLDEVPSDTTLIAFLDSDDIWPTDHLSRASKAINDGYDFYFTDNRRPGHHTSHVHSLCGEGTGRYLKAAKQIDGIVELPNDFLVGIVLKEFPTQASTVVYRHSIAPFLRFDTRLKTAGEDVLFFSTLAAASKRAGFDMESCVECGGGLNMYFANLSWDSRKYLAIKLDQTLAHRIVAKTVRLSVGNKTWNDAHVLECRQIFAFHLLRNWQDTPYVFRERFVDFSREIPSLRFCSR